jgi:hypothetical protein
MIIVREPDYKENVTIDLEDTKATFSYTSSAYDGYEWWPGDLDYIEGHCDLLYVADQFALGKNVVRSGELVFLWEDNYMFIHSDYFKMKFPCSRIEEFIKEIRNV